MNSSLPLDLPNPPSPSFDSSQIATYAAQQAGAAQLVELDMQSRNGQSRSGQSRIKAKLGSKKREDSVAIDRIQHAVAYRLRQVAVSSALKLHFAMAACIRAEQTLQEVSRTLDVQSQAQTKLVEAGIPIPDPLLVERTRLAIEDKKISNRSQLTQLRAQLAALVGPEIACNHMPVEPTAIVPSDSNVCEHINAALRCRCDLTTLIALQSQVSVDNLSQWDSVGASLSGIPLPLPGAKPFWFSVLGSTCSKNDLNQAVAARKKWLCELISERQKQITLEVELAFEKKKEAALRWANEIENQANWDQRLKQLEALGEAHGNLADQTNVKMNQFESEGKLIQRWLEWHQADIELRLAKGCE